MVLEMLVYLDNCTYGRPYDNQEQLRIHLETMAKLQIQFMIVEGKIDLAVSCFNIFENGCKDDESIKNRISSFMDSNMSIYIGEDEPSLDSLISSIASTGIKSLDASHLAASLIAKCDYFITTDDRILKYNTDAIRIVNPVQFIQEVY